MHRAVRLLIAFAVLWCGLHFDDAAQASADMDAHTLLEFSIAHDERESGEDPASNFAHSAHHHCPMATDQAGASAEAGMSDGDLLLVAATPVALNSRSQAPPLQPPAA